MKNNFPYMNKGRWYRVRVTSSGKKHTIRESEIDCEMSHDAVMLPDGFRILDVKMDIEFTSKTESVFIPAIVSEKKKQGFVVPDRSTYSDLSAFIYGYVPGKGGD